MDPKFAYRESAARISSPVGGVILLYEQAIQDLGGAVAAIEARDIELRTQKINHALLVIGQLQGCLDLERGGDVGHNLDRFYTLLRVSLMEAQVASSAAILREQIDLLLSLRSAWVEVESAEASKSEPAMRSGPPEPDTGSPPAGSNSHWRA